MNIESNKGLNCTSIYVDMDLLKKRNKSKKIKYERIHKDCIGCQRISHKKRASALLVRGTA